MKFVPLFLVPLVSARVVRPIREAPVVDVEGHAPGIGIHFTTSYATAAIRYADGEVEDLVKVEGDAEYIGLMSRWADPENKRRCFTRWERIQCEIAHAKRTLNKNLGRPATPDVGILSSFLQQVKTAIEEKIDFEVTNVFPVFPILPALEEEDIQDASDYAGVEWLFADRRKSHTFYETNAAYAALGYGVCEAWTDASKCSAEERLKRPEFVLFLNFDNSSFSASLQYMPNAYYQFINAELLDTSLGWWDLPVYEVPRAKFWARIHEVIVEIGGRSSSYQLPTTIILLGEHAEDEEFIEVVKAALWDLVENDVSLLLEANAGTNGRMLAARGAAELAGRAEYWNHPSTSRPETEGLEL